ncbi:MAG: hypothetical protein JO327_07410 [Nitrososphaeraceae archaeon]|nr:hypothetical protein [Nitrososphaeraceae archaeon]MBV9667943.1 hypothetical protein [Nitrososphaeraceae archaeon]
MKPFGDYYFWKYNTREVQELVRKIIERYVLGNLDYKDKIYLVNPNFLQTKFNTLLAIPGEIGFTVRMGIFTRD